MIKNKPPRFHPIHSFRRSDWTRNNTATKSDKYELLLFIVLILAIAAFNR